MRTDFQLRTPGVTVKAQSTWNPGASHRFNNWATPQMAISPWTILGRPATGLARNPEVGARRRNCQGSMSCWSAWANIKTYQNHVVAKHPGAPLHKQGLEFIQSCPVVYVPESEARLYKTNVISGMIINPLIGIYSDIYIPIMWIPIMKWMTMNHTSLVIRPGYTHYRYRPYIQELSADPPNYIYVYVYIHLLTLPHKT